MVSRYSSAFGNRQFGAYLAVCRQTIVDILNRIDTVLYSNTSLRESNRIEELVTCFVELFIASRVTSYNVMVHSVKSSANIYY